MLFNIIRIVLKEGARLRPQLLWLTKSIAIQEEIAQSLEADLNVIDLCRPYARRLISHKLNPIRQPYELYYWLVDMLDLTKDLPYNASLILREVRKGQFKIELQHTGLEPIRKTTYRAVSRMSLTIIIAALLISSAVVIQAKVPPLVGNIPVLALIGYIIAIIIAFMLALSIWRNKQ